MNGDARVLFNNIESHSQCSSRKSSISYVSTSEAPETPLALSSSSNPSLSANDKTFPKVYPDESLSSDTRSSALNSENLEKQRHDAKKKFSAKEGMKRSVKDLQRSAASIARFHLVLEEVSIYQEIQTIQIMQILLEIRKISVDQLSHKMTHHKMSKSCSKCLTLSYI